MCIKFRKFRNTKLSILDEIFSEIKYSEGAGWLNV